MLNLEHIGLRTPPSSLELFYLLRVISKDFVSEHMVDCHGHGVTKGEKYITGIYLEKISETKKSIKFKELKNYAHIHLGEIFTTNIEIRDSTMNISEYQSICQEL